jgi:hypothetical protein
MLRATRAGASGAAAQLLEQGDKRPTEPAKGPESTHNSKEGKVNL